MSTPKKSLLACVSAAALVASFGFVQAQSPDQDSSAELNKTMTTTDGYAYDARTAGNAAAEPGTAWSAETSSMGNTQVAANSTGFKLNTGVDGTPCIPEGSAGQRSGVYDPATSTCQTVTVQTPAPVAEAAPAPMEPAAPVAATAPPVDNSNMIVSSAPETRVDLSPPSDPLYNLPKSYNERAPRPDRN